MPDITAALVLGFAAEQFFGALISNVTDDLYKKLKGDPSKRAYKKAMGNAIKHYATGERVILARPLLEKDGLLSDKQVAAEFAKILLFEQDVNVELIGSRWKEALENPPQIRDFSEDAKLLVEFLETELRRSEVFQPVFEVQDLQAIAADTQTSTETLESIETQLGGLVSILEARFGELLDEFAHSSFSIREQIRDFTFYIEEKSRGFVGRQWVFNEVNSFLERNSRGYFFLIGDPGIGKTALAAQMVKQNGYIHHFNIKAEGINKAAIFLKNVCAQLIAAYNLEHTFLPPEASEDAGFLNKLLKEVSDKLQNGKQCIILVDALDEVDTLGLPSEANRLYLPLTVPENIFFIVTMRPDDRIRPRVDCEQRELIIDHNSADNLSDITDYIRAATVRNGIQNYIQSQNLEDQKFVTLMVKKSEGNFIYLRFVLPEIDNGYYKDFNLEDIPQGLERYYEDHWQRMKGRDLDKWFEYKLPTIVGLTIAQEPVSIDQIVFLIKLKRSQVREVLYEWQQFIHEEDNDYEGQLVTQYRLYHLSFFEFVANKQEVVDERVDLKAMHAKFADSMWDELFGENDTNTNY